eukprot:1542960-Prymnesium_polylepis.1
MPPTRRTRPAVPARLRARSLARGVGGRCGRTKSTTRCCAQHAHCSPPRRRRAMPDGTRWRLRAPRRRLCDRVMRRS